VTRHVRQLTLFDAVLLLVGGTVGPGIFFTPADVAAQIPKPVMFLFMWLIAGLITLIAGLTCAELGGMFPQAGGQYVYIREAYGGFPAFLYGWVLFIAGNTGAVAAMSISFALFAGRIFSVLSPEKVIWSVFLPYGFTWHLTRGAAVATVSIVALTLVNVFGIRWAAVFYKMTTLLLTAGVALLVALGLGFGHGSWSHFRTTSAHATPWPAASAFGIAFVALFWTYDGWTFVSWVAGEVRDAKRTVPRALLAGISLVILIYVSINALYIYALPMARAGRESTIAVAAVVALFGESMGLWVLLLITIACIGSNSIVIMSGARVYYAMAKDGAFFPALKRLHPRWGTPVTSLVVQCIWACVLTLSGSYEQLYTCYIFMMTLTYLFTVAAVFVLRRTRPHHPRTYLCVGYPWLPIVYLVVAATFVIGTLAVRPRESLAGIALAACGIPGYFYWRRQSSQATASDIPNTKLSLH
jgi:basic amino acid/polyamine antiporter, APA family